MQSINWRDYAGRNRGVLYHRDKVHKALDRLPHAGPTAHIELCMDALVMEAVLGILRLGTNRNLHELEQALGDALVDAGLLPESAAELAHDYALAARYSFMELPAAYRRAERAAESAS